MKNTELQGLRTHNSQKHQVTLLVIATYAGGEQVNASAANDQLVKNVVLDNFYVEIDKCAGEVKSTFIVLFLHVLYVFACSLLV